MKALWVLYDDSCGFCCRCAEWLREQPTFLPMSVVPAFPPYGGKNEVVVIDDEGGVYRDTDAWLMALWALRDFRGWAVRLKAGNSKELARKVVELAGTWRHGLTQLFKLTSEAELRRQLALLPESRHCDDDSCALPQCRSCGVTTHPGHSFCAKCLAEALRT